MKWQSLRCGPVDELYEIPNELMYAKLTPTAVQIYKHYRNWQLECKIVSKRRQQTILPCKESPKYLQIGPISSAFKRSTFQHQITDISVNWATVCETWQASQCGPLPLYGNTLSKLGVFWCAIRLFGGFALVAVKPSCPWSVSLYQKPEKNST